MDTAFVSAWIAWLMVGAVVVFIWFSDTAFIEFQSWRKRKMHYLRHRDLKTLLANRCRNNSLFTAIIRDDELYLIIYRRETAATAAEQVVRWSMNDDLSFDFRDMDEMLTAISDTSRAIDDERERRHQREKQRNHNDNQQQ